MKATCATALTGAKVNWCTVAAPSSKARKLTIPPTRLKAKSHAFMTIGLDVMGGDYAPAEAIAGARIFLENHPDQSVRLLLIGVPSAVEPLLSQLADFKDRWSFVPASQVVEMHEHPTKVLKEKPDSSIAVGFGMLAHKKADAFISAGNTGAMLVGAMYSVKAVPGVLRPTIASPIPRMDGKFNLMMDVGINADCKPEYLAQFATLGALFVQRVYGVENPRVALLNIGEEEGKGNLLAQAAYPLLKEGAGYNFIGNIEGRDVLQNKADVIVCEGFVGNVMLKFAESIYQIFHEQQGLRDPFLDQFNYEVYGGTPILGVNAPVVVGHGISSARAFAKMIEETARITSSGLVSAIQSEFKVSAPSE